MTLLRALALIAFGAGAGGSVAFLLRAAQHTSRLLLVILAIWVLAPFLALVLANVLSIRWPVLSGATLSAVMLVVSLGSLAVYGADAVWPRKSQPAFVFVVVPLVSWLLMALAIAIAAFLSGRLTRRGGG